MSTKIYWAVIGLIAVGLVGGFLFLLNTNKQTTKAISSANLTSQNSNSSGFRNRSGFRGQFSNLPAGSERIFGQINVVNGDKITVTGRNGSDISIVVNTSTKYVNGSVTDLTVNTRIAGYGTSNSDGSISAQQLIINPTFNRRGSSNNFPNNSNQQPSI